jgi:cyclohexanone monooxygenase
VHYPEEFPVTLRPDELESLRARYRHERDRRRRPDGLAQYVRRADLPALVDDDPFAPEDERREPLRDHVEVLIVGAGFGGILAAAALVERGIRDVRIVDHASDFGGTWYWNRYPGAQCDVESYIYFPLLEETGYVPRERYSSQPEIFEHVERLVERYGLREHGLFRTAVERIVWDETGSRWLVETDRGDRFTARFVISATGRLVRPKFPGVPGIASFRGGMFHTARWDYDYTGGDQTGGLTGLEDKRVAVIGTGATAIQVVPAVARHARQLYVFQRTPSSVAPRENAATDPAWAASLTPGWQQTRQDNLDRVLSGDLVDETLVLDGWTVVRRRAAELTAAAGPGADPDEWYEQADAEHMERLRARVAEIVTDPATADALMPWYRYECKRPGFSDDYLAAFNRPNVTLVDTSPSRGVQEIRETSIVAEGTEYPVDCIVFATGFEVSGILDRIGMEVVGAGGTTLAEHWSGGMRTVHGHSTHGFPNWFYIGHTQSPETYNYTGKVTRQARQIASILGEVVGRGATRIEATAAGEETWVREVQRLAADNAAFLAECTPSFFNSEGSGSPDPIPSSYAGRTGDFDRMIEKWMAEGDLPGMEIR